MTQLRAGYAANFLPLLIALFALLFAAASFAQDPAAPSPYPSGMTSEATMVAMLVQHGGLPAAFGFVGWMLSKSLAGFRPTLHLEIPDTIKVCFIDPKAALSTEARIAALEAEAKQPTSG